MFAEHFQNSGRFGDVAQARRGTVYVDVIDIFGFHAGIFQCQQHHVVCAVGIGSRHVVSVAVACTAGDFRINARPSFHGVFVFFQNQACTAFTEDKTVTVGIERTGCGLRVVVAGGYGLHGVETADTGNGDCRFGASGYYHVRFAQTN